MKSPLLALPPRQLWSFIFLYLRRFLQRSTTRIARSESLRTLDVKVKKLLCNIYRRDVSVDDCLQDLHPFCQVLSVDKFQGEIVLGRQISHKAEFDCYKITTEGPSTQELHLNGVASTPVGYDHYLEEGVQDFEDLFLYEHRVDRVVGEQLDKAVFQHGHEDVHGSYQRYTFFWFLISV